METTTGNEGLLRLIPSLPELLRKAVPDGLPMRDRKGRPDVIAVRRFRTTVEVDGKTFAATIDVREKHDGSYH